MTKTLCDRCGEPIKKIKPKTRRKIRVYSTPIAFEHRTVDLCENCLSELHKFIRYAESYFMTHPESAIDIFEKSKFYEN